MKIKKLSAGAFLYIDANIFIYHFGGLANGEVCTDFLLRVHKGEIKGITSILTLAEVSHRLIVLEAVEKFNLTPKQIVRKLKKKPDLVKELTKSSECLARIYEMGIEIVPIYSDVFLASIDIRKKFGLLTNDSIIAAFMYGNEINDIATNDADFSVLPEIKVWVP